ncbi:MAG: PD40 domain-containing protein [Bacteroidetes bacterium]|nr:PD40 domain-containing protein [Bacteroidota bacterium]
MKVYKKIFIIFLLLNACFVFSQKKSGKIEIEDADEHFKHKNYLMAIPIYKKFLKTDPDKKIILYKLGQCYLNTKINTKETINYFAEYSKDPKCEVDVWKYLGLAYLKDGKIDLAEKSFNKYIELKPKRKDEVSKYLENCANARALMANPVNVSYTNLGKEINSEDPDYYPFVNEDETFLVFTSRRKENIGGKKVEIDGYRSSDVYTSKVENAKWTKAINAGRFINTAYDEQAVGLKSDGLEMILYIDHIDKYGDLYISNKKDLNADFSKAKLFDPVVNQKIETSGCLSEDGRLFIFARRDKVESQSDLFMCRKLPNGNWSLAQKLSDVINTPYNEDFPYLGKDGVTLYFSSEGHNSMGGYDLFKTTWNPEENTFTKPENLGFPINGTDDDRSICVTPDNRVGYISTFRPDGFGDLDIYRIKFNDNEQITKIYTGKVFLGDTSSKYSPKGLVRIVAKNKINQSEYEFYPNSKTGKFVMALPAGAYKIVAAADGYESIKEEFVISDIGKVDIEKNKNYVLKKSQ